MNFKRTKSDEQLEQAIENILSTAWNNKADTAKLFIGAFTVGGWYLWTQQRAWLDTFLPTKEIENTAALYFPSIILVLIFFALLLVIRAVFVAYWNRKKYLYTLVLPHSKDGITVEKLQQAMRSFHGSKRSPLHRLVFGKERFTFLIHQDEKEIFFYLGAPADRLNYLKTHLSSLYARVEFHPADRLSFPGKKSVGGRMKIKRKKHGATLSLARYKEDQLPVIFNNMQPNTWVQIGFTPNNGRELEKAIEKAQKKAKLKTDFKNRTYTDKEEIKSWDHRMSGNEVAFEVTISLATEHFPGVSTLKSTGNAIATMMADVNEIKYRRWRYSVKPYPSMNPYKMLWTSSELANLVHLPYLGQEGLSEKFKDVIPHNSPGHELLPYNVLSDPLGFLFGYQLHPLIKDREVRVMPQYLGEHWLLSGENGSGKSTLLNQMLKSFLDEFLKDGISPGFSFIDPARDTALIMLNYLMTREVWEKQAAEREGREPAFKVNWEKVKWISFRNTDHPPALNLLHKMPGESDDLAVDIVFKIIKDSFDPAPQTERLLKMAIRTLMADPGKQHTILGIRPLLYDEDFREEVVERLAETGKHRAITTFWRTEAEKMMDVSAVALLNRLDIFYSNQFLQRVFGQTEFHFPVRKWMDEGYVILYDMSGMSEEEIGLVGSYLTYLYYRIADTRDENSTPLLHQLCIDEAPKVKAEILDYMVREQRKKGLSLGIICQSVLDLSEKLFKAMTEVTGNIFVCKQGKQNAKISASSFILPNQTKPVYGESELRNLPKRTAAIKIIDKVDGVEKACQTMVVVPPLDRYLPSGEVATYKDEIQTAESNAWTLGRAQELQSMGGLHKYEIDRHIEAYLYGAVVEKVAASVEPAKPVEEVSFFNPIENVAKDHEQIEEDLPLEVETSSQVDQTSELEKDELQEALQEELGQNIESEEEAAAILEDEESESNQEKSFFDF